ncbi:hypothetical protein ANCDUO_00860 [Ancylostoma duodenale]|uniref:Uncharacterized protein n=1 Tax=Ancylostoma duodenale TaxID=51022 RepID=A0A0C2HGP6_9BILA|nr:hypothetical protein ANCDUO_00860 [Ancylostoma duodenale]
MWEVFSYGEVPFAELNNFEMVSYAMAAAQLLSSPQNWSGHVHMYLVHDRICVSADCCGKR